MLPQNNGFQIVGLGAWLVLSGMDWEPKAPCRGVLFVLGAFLGASKNTKILKATQH